VALLVAGCRAEPIPPVERYPAGTRYEAREVTADGTAIRYLDVGRGPAVVFIHGFGASIYSWRHAIGPVADAGFRVIAFDNRGFGFSGKPAAGYKNADYVRLVIALFDSLGVGDAVLVGHSMGGQVAAEVALAYPERVRGLALLSSAGFGIREPALLAMARWPVVGPLVTGFRGRWATSVLLESAYADAKKVSRENVDQYYAPVAERDYGRAIRGVLREYRFDALPGRLGAVQAPTLVLWGAEDRWIPRELGARMAAELPRSAYFTIAGAGHAVAEEAPDSTIRMLVAFLKDGIPRVPADLASSPPVPLSLRESLTPVLLSSRGPHPLSPSPFGRGGTTEPGSARQGTVARSHRDH
jgi:pimeloyl-ACP methyl ester carboxylesterase